MLSANDENSEAVECVTRTEGRPEAARSSSLVLLT